MLMVHDWTGEKPGDAELARVRKIIDAILSETTGAPGHYAEKLACIVPGYERFKKSLLQLRELVVNGRPDGKSEEQAVKEIWMKAVHAKRRLIFEQIGTFSH